MVRHQSNLIRSAECHRLLDVALVLADIRNDDDLSLRSGSADQPFAQGDVMLEVDVLLEAEREPVLERLCRIVEQIPLRQGDLSRG